MTVIWQINTEHQSSDAETLNFCAQKIIEEFNFTHYCTPRIIQLAANGSGAVIGEILIAAGIPVEVLGPAHWRQTVDPTIDGPTEAGETCL
jgi:hypothetical protein